MKATELRIGNLVTAVLSDETYKIDVWALRCIDDGNYQNSNYPKTKVFQPIQLTEEWLLKFGFEDKKTCFNLSKREELGHDFGDFAVSKYDDTQMKVWRGDRYIGGCHIQHVHQLQNLYFALTNEELTLIK
jgi:hypothetical protein